MKNLPANLSGVAFKAHVRVFGKDLGYFNVCGPAHCIAVLLSGRAKPVGEWVVTQRGFTAPRKQDRVQRPETVRYVGSIRILQPRRLEVGAEKP